MATTNALMQHRPPFAGPVDVAERDDAFVFFVDVPGLTKKDLKVRLVDGCLEVGERQSKEKQ